MAYDDGLIISRTIKGGTAECESLLGELETHTDASQTGSASGGKQQTESFPHHASMGFASAW